MRSFPLLSLIVIPVFLLTGCTSSSTTMQPTQVTPTPAYSAPSATSTAVLALTPTLVNTDTLTPAPTATAKLPTYTPSITVTPTQVDTLEPENALATIQPLLEDPMNCEVPCFWGILPGKTRIDEARTLFGALGFTPFEGTDQNSEKGFYTIDYESGMGRDSSVTLFHNRYRLVENIIVRPEITEQEEESPREWIAYSPESLIKKYGKPSDVKFSLFWGANKSTETTMTMYFKDDDLVVHYIGSNLFPAQNHSPLFCPLTALFEHARLWLGPDPPNLPTFDAVSLEQATSLTMEQFTQLMLGDPQEACFTINGDLFYP
jgi:hypothetical protein